VTYSRLVAISSTSTIFARSMMVKHWVFGKNRTEIDKGAAAVRPTKARLKFV
jgi:hypothetical protein